METNTIGMSQSIADSLYSKKSVIQNASPTSGATVGVTGGFSDTTLWMTPAGTLATLTVNLPSDATSSLGDIVRIGSNKAITLLTMGGAASIINGVTALTINQIASFKKVAADTWALI